MADSLGLNYAPVAPGADSGLYTLFDSTTSSQVGNTGTYLRNYRRYALVLVNSQPGSVLAEFSDDKGTSWQQYAQQAVIAATSQRANQIALSIAGFDAVRIRWLNSGSAQSPLWLVHQWLDDLPASSHSDSSGPIRGDVLVVPVSTSSVTYAVPTIWLGQSVVMFADGADVYVQISTTATPAVVDDAVSSTVSGAAPFVLAPAGNEACKIASGQSPSIPIPSSTQTFAIKGSVACKLRTHVVAS